jgi:hypothetical protein
MTHDSSDSGIRSQVTDGLDSRTELADCVDASGVDGASVSHGQQPAGGPPLYVRWIHTFHRS